MSDDCVGCNPYHESGHLCQTCRADLELGRIVRAKAKKIEMKPPQPPDTEIYRILTEQIQRLQEDYRRLERELQKGLHEAAREVPQKPAGYLRLRPCPSMR